MARNGKSKLLLTMHLLRANNNKRRAVTNLVSHHGHHANAAYALRRRGDYEFSCANSPADPSSSSRRRIAYFPCLGAVAENEEYDYGYHQSDADAEPAPPLARIDYYASTAADAASSSPAPGEEYACASPASPALLLPVPGAASGDFSVRVSNYSSEDDDAAGVGGSDAVDADAEDFIRRFYDQLRRQNTAVALQLPYYSTQQESIAAA